MPIPQTSPPVSTQPPRQTAYHQAIRALPEIGLPWLDVGLALGLVLMLRLT